MQIGGGVVWGCSSGIPKEELELRLQLKENKQFATPAFPRALQDYRAGLPVADRGTPVTPEITSDGGRRERRRYPCGEVHPGNTSCEGCPTPRCLRGFLFSAR
jgi:hypothetical protein